MSEHEIRRCFAEKLAYYRKAMNWSQTELAEKINYSDKSVSKWERGEGLPDLVVTCRLAELFGVGVGDLLNEEPPRKPKPRRNRILTTLIAVGLPFLAAAILSFACQFVWEKAWFFYIAALPVSAIVAIVFTCLWWNRWWQFLSVSALIWTVPTAFVVLLHTISGVPLIYTVSAAMQVLTVLWYLRKPT